MERIFLISAHFRKSRHPVHSEGERQSILNNLFSVLLLRFLILINKVQNKQLESRWRRCEHIFKAAGCFFLSSNITLASLSVAFAIIPNSLFTTIDLTTAHNKGDVLNEAPSPSLRAAAEQGNNNNPALNAKHDAFLRLRRTIIGGFPLPFINPACRENVRKR